MRPEDGRLSAAAVMAARRRLGPMPLPWLLRTVPVCGSTEPWLSQWLQEAQANDATAEPSLPRALLATHQSFGHGQRGRPWSAPPGGVWLSAALPWPRQPSTSASLSLAVAVGLALELEALDLAVQIKWPNDLYVHGRKIAGLLPRLRLRSGQVAGARVGIGLNGCNRVPPGAINVAQALAADAAHRRKAGHSIPALAARVLRALEWAVAAAGEAETVRQQAEARLLPGAAPVIDDGLVWQPVGLDRDGALRVRRQGQERRLQRTF